MQKALLTVLGVMLLVVIGLSVALKLAYRDTEIADRDRDTAQAAASQARTDLDQQRQQSARWEARFANLDAALTGLGSIINRNNQTLAEQLAGLGQIQKIEGDTDAQITCLDTRVPGQLDQWLLDSPAAAANGH